MKTMDVETLRQLLDYNPDTGELWWKERTPDMFVSGVQSREHKCKAWNNKFAGKEALTANSNGYKVGHINSKLFLAHRVIYALHYGAWPQHTIDHINGDPAVNRISNLRNVPHKDNLKNQKRRSTNISGHMGVRWRAQSKKWYAEIRADGRNIYLGRFTSKEDAVAARAEAEIKYGYHPNHGRA